MGELFRLGDCVITPGALEATSNEGKTIVYDLLLRHAFGDWGDLNEDDKKSNNLAVAEDTRILSAYILPKTQVKVLIITEADRSSTTILLPDEY